MSLTITPQVTGQEASSSITYCYLYEPLRIDVDESVSSSGIRVFIDLEVIDSSNTSSVIETLVDYGEFDVNPGKTLSIDLMKIVRQHHDSNLYKFSNIDDIVNSGWDSIVSKYIYNFKIRSSVSPTPIEIKKLPIIGGRNFQDFKPTLGLTNKISTVVNGDYFTDVSWTKVNNFTISEGKAIVVSTDLVKSQIFQASADTSEVLTKVKFTVSNFSGTGIAQMRYPLIVNITGNGTYEAEGIGDSTLRTQFDATADDLSTPLTFKIDDVSVYPKLGYGSNLISSTDITSDWFKGADVTSTDLGLGFHSVVNASGSSRIITEEIDGIEEGEEIIVSAYFKGSGTAELKIRENGDNYSTYSEKTITLTGTSTKHSIIGINDFDGNGALVSITIPANSTVEIGSTQVFKSYDSDYLDEISKQEVDMYSKWNGLQLINIDLANLTSSSTDKSPTITKVVNSNTNGDFCGGQVVWKSRLGGWCTWAFQLKRERQDKSYGGGFDVDMFEATNGNAYIPVNYTSVETSYSVSLKDLSLSSNELRAVQSIEASPAVYYMPNSDGRLELMRLGSSSAPIFNMANGGDFSVTLNSISKNFQKTK